MSVGCAPRAVRVRRRAPNCSSSRATRRERTGLERPMRSAARAKEPVSATRTKERTSTMSVDERCIFRNTMMLFDGLPTTHVGAYFGFRNATQFSPKGRNEMNILIVSSSANGDASVSNSLVGRFVDHVRDANPEANVVIRDVGANP